MREARFCYKHPAEITKRKCFDCDRPICARCQVKIDHHLFCSRSCHEEHQRALESASTKIRYKRYAIYGMLVLLLGGFLYFALLADAFYSGGDVAEAVSESTEISPSLPVSMEEQKKEDILIEHPLNGLRSRSEQVQVEGPAPHNSVVGMLLNGSLIDSTVAHGGYYRFPSVILTKPTNVLQTRFYARNGSSDSSPAIMVFYQNATASKVQDTSFFQDSPFNISRGDSRRKELVLTFDGSSEANSANAILKSLDESNIRSTVFLTRQFMERHPEITRLIAAKQEVGTLTDPDLHRTSEMEITKQELHNQLKETAAVFQQVTGKEMSHFWRTSSDRTPEILKWGTELGYVHVAWTADSSTRQNMDSLDWVTNPDLPEYFPALLIKDRLLSFGQNEPAEANGSIIVMHLGSFRQQEDRLDPWLPEIINTFQQRGYRFVTIGELISRNQEQETDLIETASNIR